MKKKAIKNAFASGKDAWASTLKASAQMRTVTGRTSQNVPKNNKGKK
jgi:hypothetical protein